MLITVYKNQAVIIQNLNMALYLGEILLGYLYDFGKSINTHFFAL